MGRTTMNREWNEFAFPLIGELTTGRSVHGYDVSDVKMLVTA